MSKHLTALAFIVAIPLAVALAQGVVAPTQQGGTYGVQAEPITIQGIPTPRQLWHLTSDDPPFSVPADKVLVVTEARPAIDNTISTFRVVIDNEIRLRGKLTSTLNVCFGPGYRISPSSSVVITSPTSAMVLGYLAPLDQPGSLRIAGIPAPRELFSLTDSGSTFIVPAGKALVITDVRGNFEGAGSTQFQLFIDGQLKLQQTLYGDKTSSYGMGYRIGPLQTVDLNDSYISQDGSTLALGYLVDV